MECYNAFKELAGRVITMPNETRCNSWTTVIEEALSLKDKVNKFIADRENLRSLLDSLALLLSIRLRGGSRRPSSARFLSFRK